jgi:hypothetical protein
VTAFIAITTIMAGAITIIAAGGRFMSNAVTITGIIAITIVTVARLS